MNVILKAALSVIVVVASAAIKADECIVAVANNFSGPMQQLSQDFAAHSEHTVAVSTGSTGQLYAQISNGAPFDLFFSADTEHPKMLVDHGLGFDSYTYAQGSVVLWSESPGLELKSLLESGQFDHIALADPKLAPYGLAAQQTLEKLNLFAALKNKFVLGKGLNPTYQYVVSGNALLGFVAKSQVYKENAYKVGSYWEVPRNLYDPIKQDAVVLDSGRENQAAQAFLRYLASGRAQQIIHSYGYL
jgi:molybdate transport system substrate-binding protein